MRIERDDPSSESDIPPDEPGDAKPVDLTVESVYRSVQRIPGRDDIDEAIRESIEEHFERRAEKIKRILSEE